MIRFLALRVRPSVRLLAAIGLVMAANLQLDWTPAAPWTPTFKVLAVASAWGPTAFLVGTGLQAIGDLRWELRGWTE